MATSFPRNKHGWAGDWAHRACLTIAREVGSCTIQQVVALASPPRNWQVGALVNGGGSCNGEQVGTAHLPEWHKISQGWLLPQSN